MVVASGFLEGFKVEAPWRCCSTMISSYPKRETRRRELEAIFLEACTAVSLENLPVMELFMTMNLRVLDVFPVIPTFSSCFLT